MSALTPKFICRGWNESESINFWFGLLYAGLIRLIVPKGSDKYSPGDLELLLWISMLIGFRLDLTVLASPWRGTASSQGEGFCMGVSMEKEGGVGRGGKRKGKASFKGAGWMEGDRR